MARFLIVPLPLTGHLNAALALGQALAASGHHVAWCGAETDLRPLVGPNAEIYPTGKRYYRQDTGRGLEAARTLWTGYLIPLNRFILDPADAAVAEYRPDVVVVDQYAVAAGLAAHRRGVRWASLCTGAMELTPPSWELPGHQEWVAEQLARIWAKAGLPVDPAIDLRFSPYLVLALTSSALVGTAPLPPQCRLVGPVLGKRPNDPAFAWQDWDSGRRHVLITVGTLAEHLARDFYARMLAALAPLAAQVQPVLVAPAGAVPDPPDWLLTATRVPMLELLPELDAVVCHGGMGTVTEALAQGVPLVVAPIRHDQPAVAAQVAGAGAGIAVSFSSASAADLTSAVTAVLTEPAYRAAARRVAESFTAAGGGAAAVAELAALAAGG
ncbi:MAG TPA: nucleotide disphospho-sugar-binding domain-containing protein [Jatrophihabitans sp.]|uniref:glycosyltransferase n=1 Tax=Jatrophihabitans sp. TaxID=1932789 RepID=UPI002EEB89DC